MTPYNIILNAPSGTYIEDKKGIRYIKEGNLGTIVLLKKLDMPDWFPCGMFTMADHRRMNFRILTFDEVNHG